MTRVCNSLERETARCFQRVWSVPKEVLQKLQSISPDAREGVPFG